MTYRRTLDLVAPILNFRYLISLAVTRYSASKEYLLVSSLQCLFDRCHWTLWIHLCLSLLGSFLQCLFLSSLIFCRRQIEFNSIYGILDTHTSAKNEASGVISLQLLFYWCHFIDLGKEYSFQDLTESRMNCHP